MAWEAALDTRDGLRPTTLGAEVGRRCVGLGQPAIRVAAELLPLIHLTRLHDAQDGGCLVHQRHRRLRGHFQRVAAILPRGLELVHRNLLPFDIEVAVRTANDTVPVTFSS
jgi:hypothetical protein